MSTYGQIEATAIRPKGLLPLRGSAAVPTSATMMEEVPGFPPSPADRGCPRARNVLPAASACDNNRFVPADILLVPYASTAIADERLVAPKALLPMVCIKCGYQFLFDAEYIGLV